jgi:hypothetical protein
MNDNDDTQGLDNPLVLEVERIANLHRSALQHTIARAAAQYLETANQPRTVEAELALIMIITEFASYLFEARFPAYPDARGVINSFANRAIEEARACDKLRRKILS